MNRSVARAVGYRVGSQLRPLCEDRALSQEELARRLQVDPSNVNCWMSGRRPVPAERWQALSQVLETSFEPVVRSVRAEAGWQERRRWHVYGQRDHSPWWELACLLCGAQREVRQSDLERALADGTLEGIPVRREGRALRCGRCGGRVFATLLGAAP